MATGMLKMVGNDFKSTLIAMKWITFLQEKVSALTIPRMFEYYGRIGWLSPEAQKQMTDIAAGMRPSEEVIEPPSISPFVPAMKRQDMEDFEVEEKRGRLEIEIEDWRLSAEDHMRSYMFIQELKGEKVSKDEWNAIELRLDQFKQDLRAYYGV